LIPILGRKARRRDRVALFRRRADPRRPNFRQAKSQLFYNSPEHILSASADHRVLKRLGQGVERFILLVGSRAPHKNVDTVVAAHRILNDASFHLVHAGGADGRIFASEQPRSRMIELGHVTDAELRALYERASCLVFPSLYEGFGLPPLEAMTCGCPVIAARATSLPEVCGNAAVYFDPRNPAELASRIREVMAGDEFRAVLARRGVMRAQAFSWRSSAEALMRVVEAVADEGPYRYSGRHVSY